MSNIIITLDYELFLSPHTGTAEKCMLEPTDHLLEVLSPYKAKCVFFVDAGYLLKLKDYQSDHSALAKNYHKICDQLKQLAQAEHDIQLHIHPHWEDSYFDGQKWHIHTERYRLHDFPADKIKQIVKRYKNFLEEVSGQDVFAFRAGGWCIQPFPVIQEALQENGIWLDSTVFKGGYNKTATHYYDFRNYPKQNNWFFKDDPLKPDRNGFFHEVPIQATKVSPFFFWQLSLKKLLKHRGHKTYGDGRPLPPSKKWVIKKLLLPSYSVVSIDGLKATFLETAFQKFQKSANRNDTFVIIGHPKALTSYSLKKLNQFIKNHHNSHRFTTFQHQFPEKKKASK